MTDLVEMYKEFKNSTVVQKTSSSLLLMNVEDILGFA